MKKFIVVALLAFAGMAFADNKADLTDDSAFPSEVAIHEYSHLDEYGHVIEDQEMVSFLQSDEAKNMEESDSALLKEVLKGSEGAFLDLTISPFQGAKAVDEAVKLAYEPWFEQCGKIKHKPIQAKCLASVTKAQKQAGGTCKKSLLQVEETDTPQQIE